MVHKKNSTGLFRNWKKVQIIVTQYGLRWKSQSDVYSRYFRLKKAYVTPTTDFRFQICNMLIQEEDNVEKLVVREFAAESLRDLRTWMRILQVQ